MKLLDEDIELLVAAKPHTTFLVVNMGYGRLLENYAEFINKPISSLPISDLTWTDMQQDMRRARQIHGQDNLVYTTEFSHHMNERFP